MLPTGRILEGLVTTSDASGRPHLAPMGPIVSDDMKMLRLRPFQTSSTFQNLQRTRVGVLHVTDDVGLIARAAVGQLTQLPVMLPAEKVQGWILANCCRWYEFQVTSLDASQDRSEIMAEVVARGAGRDFFGFNRAMHAVLELAILATRVHLLPPEFLQAEIERLAVPVQKTAGPREQQAYDFLVGHLQANLAQQAESNVLAENSLHSGEAP